MTNKIALKHTKNKKKYSHQGLDVYFASTVLVEIVTLGFK